MPIARAQPVRFTPKGLSDSYDATDVFPGACKSLQNLVFDQANPELLAVRPGVGFGFSVSTGFISYHVAVGTLIYGMIASNAHPGYDDPFCFDTVANALIPLAGFNTSNLPVSPSTTGTWTPPVMAIVGIYLLIAHPGYSGTSNVFGYIDLTTNVYSAGNLAVHPMPGVPTNVANYNNRAYFSLGNQAYYSDVLNPLSALNAGQAVTLGDNTPITALAGLPIQTTTAGVVGALVAFKGNSIWQITGDNTTLAVNFITLTTGCIAPRSVTSTSFGLAFIGISGPLYINSGGAVAPINYGLSSQVQADIQTPFQLSTSPSRIAANFQGAVYRVCVPSAVSFGLTAGDYWFDLGRQRWNGPHSFAYDCASSVSSPATGSYFLLSSYQYPGLLFSSVVHPQSNVAQVYNDLGNPITVSVTSATLPKDGHMQQKQVVEATVELCSFGLPVTYNITGLDPRGNQVGVAGLSTSSVGATWGSNTWGSANWVTRDVAPNVYQIPWSAPVVFQKMAITVSAVSVNGLSIGTMYFRYQDAGYLTGY